MCHVAPTGAIAVIVTYPLDLMRARMAVQVAPRARVRAAAPARCARSHWPSDAVRSLSVHAPRVQEHVVERGA
jgi:hypothetical protein